MILHWLRKLGSGRSAPEPSQPEEARPPKVVDLLSASTRDAIVASHLEKHLAPSGFVQVTPRRWVNGADAPARQVFEMALLKGAAITPLWGFSLDFVPHLSASRLCWHRTDRSAKFDVVVDPRARKDDVSFLFGAERLNDDLNRSLPGAVEWAQESWRRGATWPGMLDLVREIREPQGEYITYRFGYQLSLAFMFLSAKTGDLASAQAEVDIYVRKRELPVETATKLAQLVQEAAANPQ